MDSILEVLSSGVTVLALSAVAVAMILVFRGWKKEEVYSDRLLSVLLEMREQALKRGAKMSEHELILRMFVSSPSDVALQRKTLEEVIKELNPSWRELLGVRVRPLHWKTNVPPGLGRDAQEVIDREIGEDYEIYLAIIGTRLGTPTANADSGTVGEFRRAFERSQDESEPMAILVYFQDTPMSPSDIDMDEYMKVREFQRELRDKGVLYQEFSDSEEFKQLLRIHLPRVVKSVSEKIEISEDEGEPVEVSDEGAEVGVSSALEEEATDKDWEDYGILDLVDQGMEKSEELQEVTRGMAGDIQEFGQRIEKRTEQLNSIGPFEDRKAIKSARAIISSTVGDVSHFATQMEGATPLFAETYEDFVEIQAKFTTLSEEYLESEELEEVRDQRRQLLKSIRTAREGAERLRDSIEGWPQLEKNLTKSKKRAVASLDSFISEAKKAEKLTQELLEG